jgi:hypothetical protein
MWEMLGFTNEQTRIPNNPRYWKNIISDFVSFTDREGIDLDASPPNPIIDVDSEQGWVGSITGIPAICEHITDYNTQIYYNLGMGTPTWYPYELTTSNLNVTCNTNSQTIINEVFVPNSITDGSFKVGCTTPINTIVEVTFIEANEIIFTSANDACSSVITDLDLMSEFGYNYYYPVLPRYDKFGEWIYDYENEQYDYPYNNIPFPLTGPITDIELNDDSLIIDITPNQVETNVLDDGSGNENYGFAYSDYKPKFDDQSFEINKVKNTNRIKTSKNNGAF